MAAEGVPSFAVAPSAMPPLTVQDGSVNPEMVRRFVEFATTTGTTIELLKSEIAQLQTEAQSGVKAIAESHAGLKSLRDGHNEQVKWNTQMLEKVK